MCWARWRSPFACSPFPAAAAPRRRPRSTAMAATEPALAAVRALVFDVFGTVVDWRGSIIAELETLGRRKGIGADWGAVADDWRRGYQPAMARVRSGALAWTNIDGLHRLI